jgi:pimeloyl-ACP methyl ester carboxylesterase
MDRRVARLVGAALAAGAALLGPGGPAAGAQAGPAAGPASFAGAVDVGGGRRLYLECAGAGAPGVPTVVFEAGYRNHAEVWHLPPAPDGPAVWPAVARFARVCAYDRPGTLLPPDGRPSNSDPVPMPRTAPAVVADLHALLRAAGVPGPYVLVGHSLGGFFSRLYAATYPDEVAGLVLVDAVSETLEGRLTPAQWAAYVRVNALPPPELAADRGLETLDFDAAAAALRRAAAVRPLRALPLYVLSHGEPFGVPADYLGFAPDALERAWSGAQDDLAALRPGARHVVATASGHYIQWEQPELVIAAVRDVVAAAAQTPRPARRGLPRTGTGLPAR